MSKHDLIVTKGDGVPLPDQAAAVEEFKRRYLSTRSPGDYAPPDVEDFILRHACDKELSELMLEKLEVELVRMRCSWQKPGVDVPAWAEKQIQELRYARNWMRDFYEQNWGRDGI